ncbi:MAG: hypothetical protein AB8B55_20025 [Mariniblastus sp.]
MNQKVIQGGGIASSLLGSFSFWLWRHWLSLVWGLKVDLLFQLAQLRPNILVRGENVQSALINSDLIEIQVHSYAYLLPALDATAIVPSGARSASTAEAPVKQ